ncbi:MAG: ribose-phosphate pyrophosphokinase [Clostridiales bacterium]|nr:ribose-phosphate pyrophosphokinase [Clostridiales bacterium]
MDDSREQFSRKSDIENELVPFGPIGIISLKGTEEMARTIDSFLVEWRHERGVAEKDSILFKGYEKESFIVDTDCPRFRSGEGKGIINSSTRGHDLYFIVDVTNYSITYEVGGRVNHYSPDDHYQDLKRLIAAAAGRAKRMTVIMPFLYEGRQHNREGRESLDCAQMLKELVSMGVTNIITFDANDPRVQNAIPLHGFDTIAPTYQYIKALCREYDDIDFDSEHIMVISPDEPGMRRAIYFAGLLGVDMGMFYKRKDYSLKIEGENPVIANEFLGSDVSGKDVIIIDDMISSGYTVLDVARELKKMKARRVFICVSYGLFTNGLEEFDRAYEDGVIDRIFTTNLVYQPEELKNRPWHANVNMGKYMALLIDYLNHDYTISGLLTPVDRINRLLTEYKQKRNAAQ